MKTTTFLTSFNFGLKRASRLADALISYAEGYRLAVKSGAEVIDLRVKPNAQPSYTLTPEAAQRFRDAGERVPRRVSPKTFDEADLRMSKIPGIPTNVTPDEFAAALDAVLALKAQARVIDFMARKRDRRALDLAGTVLSNLDRAVALLEGLDPSLTEWVLRDFDKAHIEDFDEATDLDVAGFHQTDTAAGDATTIRYDSTRQLGSNAKADHHAAGTIHALDEDALAEAMAA